MKLKRSNVVILIPAYQPRENFITYVEELLKQTNEKILIVDDGSGEEYRFIFDTLSKKCIILHNHENQGKGYSLKKGFEYILNEDIPCDGVITVDADSQHKIEDVIHIISIFDPKNTDVIFGVRNFSLPQVPFHRKYANKLTSFLCKLRYHHSITDTQTGLRLYSKKLLKDLICIPGQRFEYEFAVLVYFFQKQISILEVPIETIYNNGENVSHFRIIHDSYQIYRQFFKREEIYDAWIFYYISFSSYVCHFTYNLTS